MERLTQDERRLLELLATSDDGCTEAFLQGAYGFMLDLMIGVVRAGLMTATAERDIAAGEPVHITRVRITDTGRRALAER